MIEIEAPDGTIVEFPEGTSREAMAAAMAKRFGAPSSKGAGRAAPGEAAAPVGAAAPVAAAADGRKAFESELRQYYAGLKGGPLDTSVIEKLGQKYLGGAPTNIPEIEAFYKKYGTLDPRVRDLAPEAQPLPAAKPEEIVTTVPRAGEGVQAARAFGKGLLSNFADEAEAATRMLLSGEISSDEYYRIKDQINADYNAWAKANPGAALSGELAGGVAQMFVPGIGIAGKAFQGASGLGRAMLTGGASGALSGLGEAETLAPSDVAPSVLEEGAIGAIGGGIVGKGTELAGRSLLPAVQRLRGQPVPSPVEARAAEMLYRATEGGVSPERAAGLSRLAQRYGVPTPLGMATPELANLSKIVMSRAPLQERTLARTLAETQEPEAVRGRITEQVERALPGAEDFGEAEELYTQKLRRNANTRYDAAYAAAPEIRDPAIRRAFSNPTIQAAYQDALRVSRNEMDAAQLRGEDPSQYAMKEFMDPVLDAEGNLTGLQPSGTTVPDLRSLDAVKQALDRQISGLYASGRGGEATALKELRNAFVKRLDEVGPPEYKAARAQFAGDMEVREALQYGRDLVGKNVPVAQVKKFVAGIKSDAERDALRNGVFEGIIAPLETSTTSRNFAREIVRDKRKLDKLEAVLPPAEFKFLSKALEKERQLFQSIATARGGSQTVPLAEAVRQFDEIMAGGNIEEAVNFLAAGPQGRMVAIAKFVTRLNPRREFGDKVYTELSRALSADTPDKLRDVLTMLRNSKSYAQSASAISKAATGEVAAVAGNVLPSTVEDRGTNPPPAAEIGKPKTTSIDETLRKADEALGMATPDENAGLAAVPVGVAETGEAPFSGSLGERNMNRGNIIDGPWARRQPGYVGPGEGGFARFESVEAGDAAQAKLIAGKYEGGATTVNRMIDSYLGGDPRNKPAEIRNYKRYVADRLGISPGDKISPRMIPQLSQAMIEFETGTRPQ